MATATATVTANPTAQVAPTASYTFTTSGLVAYFTDTSTAGSAPITGWAWQYGTGATSTAQNPTHTYAASNAGTWPVTLTVTDSSGLTGTVTQNVTVTAPASSYATATATVTANPAATAPTGTPAGTDQTNIEPWTLVTLSSAATTHNWTQTAGTTVALSSTTAANPTFTAPASAQTQTLTFSDNGSTVNVTILPATEFWLDPTGTWRPMQVIPL